MQVFKKINDDRQLSQDIKLIILKDLPISDNGITACRYKAARSIVNATSTTYVHFACYRDRSYTCIIK